MILIDEAEIKFEPKQELVVQDQDFNDTQTIKNVMPALLKSAEIA